MHNDSLWGWKSGKTRLLVNKSLAKDALNYVYSILVIHFILQSFLRNAADDFDYIVWLELQQEPFNERRSSTAWLAIVVVFTKETW